MAEFLPTIIAYKRQLLAQKKVFYKNIREKTLKAISPADSNSFKENIAHPGKINLIAEIKKASPSAGIFKKDFNIEEIAKIYAQYNAAAISVLTEDKYFLGKPEYIQTVTKCVNIPVLAKDFFISADQIYEAKVNGASAVLLIAAMLSDGELNDFLALAQDLGLAHLVEIHNEKELDRAINLGAEIIGVNNRDLRTLDVKLKTSERLIPRIPKGKIIVAESGLKTYDDIRRMQDLGVHAVLIGETFMRAADIGKKIEEIMHGAVSRKL